ncbi:MAG: VWA domain-containing protein [Deltaproteobacteria bacterium]|nr:VWA domain-containing protein [Deltaproteobacteria bacterium]
MKRTFTFLAIASMLIATAIYAGTMRNRASSAPPLTVDAPVDPPANQKQPKIDIVIALDTSGSMSGLINAARTKLWDIVNEASKATPTPKLRVGLVTYGSQGSENDGYVIIQKNLTGDLDTLYGKLFALRTSGGTEYVGRAVYRSLKEMSWDSDPDTLRQIYVAGNESADQDRGVPVSEALQLASRMDVFVNAIFCGSEGNHDARSWLDVANKGRGMYAAIDHNHGTVAIKSPYDAKLGALSARLNNTYVGYGSRGAAATANQQAQDRNAQAAHPSAAAGRALAKSSSVYRNDDWDLVDARRSGKKVPKRAMPARLRKMDKTELRSYLDTKAKERAKVRDEIRKLSEKRKAYVSTEMKRQGKTEGKAFNTAVKRAMRKQAGRKGIKMMK